jgi:predicted nucleotidyltransferase
MPTNSKLILLASKKLKSLLSSKEIIDIIIFGSAVKGKVIPRDIDIAVICHTKPSKQLQKKLAKLKGFHVSILTVKDFFTRPAPFITALFAEGYSIKNKKPLAEHFGFLNRVMYCYDLSSLAPSQKVRIVNILRGKKREAGLIEKNKGEFIAKQVFVVPPEADKLFEAFFGNFKIKYKKWFLLMH